MRALVDAAPAMAMAMAMAGTGAHRSPFDSTIPWCEPPQFGSSAAWNPACSSTCSNNSLRIASSPFCRPRVCLRNLLLIRSASSNTTKGLPSDAGHEKQLDRALAVGEGICIASATSAFIVAHSMGHLHPRRRNSDSLVGSASSPSTLLSPIPQRIRESLPAWQNLFLLLALIINAISRARQWHESSYNRRGRNYVIDANLELEDRIKKLEEEVGDTVTIVRVLSKHLEKLGVRFRVTRRTLRDPIQETAVLAQKTSDSLNVLAARGNEVEKGLEAIQYALLGMQDNQTKQLELISALAKLVKDRTKNQIMEPNLAKSNGNDSRHIDKNSEISKHKIQNSVTASPARDNLIPGRVDYWLNNESSSSKAEVTQ